ncbi:MAG: 3' terminal RNA ribose 2'-O-methyltransferase Hen1 [Rhodanobacter sp.]|jgi:3' terminal RNA ribose 2'-O-methyltransferase Hen1|nr:3' terminal RNA ribose 2'-O-methyltransferase Hen1 [Rhodanobacter sp.]
MGTRTSHRTSAPARKSAPRTTAPAFTSVADALFTGTQQRVLALLFGQPERSFFTKELIDLTGGGSGAVQRELARLQASGLIVQTVLGNQKHYRANADAPIFVELCGIAAKMLGPADMLRRALLPLADALQLALLYGSVARRSDTAHSDFDVLLVSDTLTLEQVYAALAPCRTAALPQHQSHAVHAGRVPQAAARAQPFPDQTASGRDRGLDRRQTCPCRRWITTLLMKLGAAKNKAPATWRLVGIQIADDGARFDFWLKRKKLREVPLCTAQLNDRLLRDAAIVAGFAAHFDGEREYPPACNNDGKIDACIRRVWPPETMLLEITTTHQPASDLGYLLAKHPARCQHFELPFGAAHVFYSQADHACCTAVLLMEIDPVSLVRGTGDKSEGPLSQYVNDRPYVASSFLSVAIARVFGSAMAGVSKGRQELADQAIPLEANIPVLRSKAGADMIVRCFEPLGYRTEVAQLPLDPRFPEWGEGDYFALRLSQIVRLRDLLTHLYILLPAIDGDKHYFVGEDEVDKLVGKAGEWLSSHPEREWIANRYLKRRKPLVRAALAQLLETDEEDVDTAEAVREAVEERLERPLSLNEQRIGAVLAALRQAGVRSIMDLGCGEGRLIAALLQDRQFSQILGVDVSLRALDYAAERLNLDRIPPLQRERVTLLHGALTYRDRRLEGFDAACAIEVIEHLDPSRLDAFERMLFEFAKPGTIVITTPNAQYNVRFENLPAGRMRHPDHRFEWTRGEFQAWSEQVAARHDYTVRFLPVGPEDAQFGAPTQMGVFRR